MSRIGSDVDRCRVEFCPDDYGARRHDCSGQASSVLSALWRTARPKQWLKNILVVAAPGAAGVLDDGNNLGLTLVAFV